MKTTKKSRKKEINKDISIAVDIMIARFDEIKLKLDQLLWFYGVHSDKEIYSESEQDDIRVVNM